MKINPSTLRALRSRRRLSQDALAAVAELSKRTISRIEGGEADRDIRASTAESIANALNVTAEDLGKPVEDRSDTERNLRKAGYRRVKAYIDGETALAYALVERRYKVSIRSQIEMAPLFLSLLAEGSFAWRRKKLDEVCEAAERLSDSGKDVGHLAFAQSAYHVANAALDEEASIDKCDLFGAEVAQEAFDFGYDRSTSNPFADYLRSLAKSIDSAIVELDPNGRGFWKTVEGMPEYAVQSTELERITGEDIWAKYALKHGHARLRDIPEVLQGDEARDARIAWLAARVPPEERKAFETLDGELDLSFLDEETTGGSNA